MENSYNLQKKLWVSLTRKIVVRTISRLNECSASRKPINKCDLVRTQKTRKSQITDHLLIFILLSIFVRFNVALKNKNKQSNILLDNFLDQIISKF